MPEESERIDPIELFSPAVREDVLGLTHLGYLTDRFRFCGHSFGIETLRPRVKYAIGQAMQPYRNTLAEPDAFSAFHAAMALTSVDGQRDFCPEVGDDLQAFVEARFSWITVDAKWQQPLIDYIFIKYLELEQRANAGVVELESLSSRGLDTSLPSPDSLTAPGSSDEATSENSKQD